MKRFFVVMLALMLCVSASAMAQSWQGKGEGKGGEIVVDVTIEEGVLTDIKVVSHQETPGFDSAMDTLSAAMLAANSAQADAVSGCTLTSRGFNEAVAAAVAASGMELKAVGPAAEAEPKAEETLTTEVLVVGAGGAGFSAAIEAVNSGAQVMVLEKMSIAGGNTLISGAEMAAPGNWLQEKEGIVDSAEMMIEDMLVGGDRVNDPALVATVANNALESAIWLRDEVGVIWEDELMFFGGHSVKRSLIPLGASGVEIITKQLAKAEALEIPVLYNTRATKLIQDEAGRVIGVQAESEDTLYTIYASHGVVLTTGGFGSNIEMRVKYNPAIDESILSTNSVGSTGDGILLAQEVGADVTGMEHIQTYPICDPLTGTLLYFDDARLYGHTIIVNLEGKRFVEELGRRDEMSMAIKAQTGHVCYELVDQNGYELSKLEENHMPEIEYLYNNGLLVKADTLEEAAGFFGIDAQALKKTVADYNSYVDAGSDPEFNKRSMPSKIEVGPYYIIKAAPAVHHTMGGLKINEQANVLNTEGEVIEGLFAAGEVTGGIHGTNRLGSNAIADIIVFGRIAGRNAAHNAE